MNLRKRRKFSIGKAEEKKRKTKRLIDDWLNSSAKDGKNSTFTPPTNSQKISEIKQKIEEPLFDERRSPFANMDTPEEMSQRRESLVDTLTEDDQSNMISNLSKLTQKNILNRLSESKDLITVEKKNKGSFITRETRVRRVGDSRR